MDEFCLLVSRGADAHCDDEGVLALKGRDEGAGVGVVDFVDGDARWHGGGAGVTGEGCDVVLAGCEEGLDDVFAAGAGGLVYD